jgi:hypothetical protein
LENQALSDCSKVIYSFQLRYSIQKWTAQLSRDTRLRMVTVCGDRENHRYILLKNFWSMGKSTLFLSINPRFQATGQKNVWPVAYLKKTKK